MHNEEKASKEAGEKTQALKEAAKHLVSLGYGVIQTGKDGDPKRPRKRNWNREVATTPEAIEEWEWPSEEGAGIAIVPFGRVVAIDIDAPNKDEKKPSREADGLYDYLLRKFPELAHAWREKTPGGGYHIVVRVSPAVDQTKLKKTAEGPYGVKVELKGWQRGAIVVAPTEVDGKPYEILHGPVPWPAYLKWEKNSLSIWGYSQSRRRPTKRGFLRRAYRPDLQIASYMRRSR